MSKVLQERGFGILSSSTETNPRDHVRSISTIIEADSYPIYRMGFSQYAVSTRQNRTLMYKTKQTTIPFLSRLNGYHCKEKKGSYGPQFLEAYSEASHINNSIPRKEKDLGSFILPCFINNFCFNTTLIDLGASVSVMPFLTHLNLGLGELAHTKLTVELADRTMKYPKGIAENMLVELRKDQVDDLMPTIKEGEVIEEFRARNDARMDKMEYKGNNVVGALMNIPIFVGTFSNLTDFIVLEDMDVYRDEGMGDVIFGEPFLREVGINAKRFV
ncbi:hypothetical protein Tco_0311917 [Tanacetum coccineum]